MAGASIPINVDLPELNEIRAALLTIIERLTHMATQDQVDTLTALVNAVSARIETAVSDIRQDIADIQSAHPNVDLAGLEASVATLSGAASDLDALDAENPAPPA